MLLPHSTSTSAACMDQEPCLPSADRSPGVLQHVLDQQNTRVARHQRPSTKGHVTVQIMTVEREGHGVGPSHAGSPLAALPNQGHHGNGSLQTGQIVKER